MAVVRTLIGNVRGPQGEDGSSFAFAKTYATIAAMNSDFSGSDTQTGDYVLISAASINDADNGKMYRKGNSAWIYVAKITGPRGADGPTGPLCPLDTSMAVTVAGQAALDAALGPTLAGKLDATGDSANNTVTYTSDDVADGSASAWETVQPLTSEEKHESLFAKISKVIKNVRFLYKLLGTTDISGIGSGTVTDILSALHSGKFDKANVVNNLTTTTAGYALDAREGKTLADNVSTLNDALGGQWVVLPSGSNFNSLTSNARYYVGDLSANGNYPTGIGSTGSVEIQKMGSYIRQVVYTNLGEAYRFSYDNGASWSEWADTWVILATGTNLNTLVNNAKYMVGNMGAMVNGPSGKGSTGTLEIQRVRASYVRQIAYLNSGASYRFSYDNGGTWTGWA